MFIAELGPVAVCFHTSKGSEWRDIRYVSFDRRWDRVLEGLIVGPGDRSVTVLVKLSVEELNGLIGEYLFSNRCF